jgi:hypothetical protein
MFIMKKSRMRIIFKKVAAETPKWHFCPQTLISSFFEPHPIFKGIEGCFLIF